MIEMYLEPQELHDFRYLGGSLLETLPCCFSVWSSSFLPRPFSGHRTSGKLSTWKERQDEKAPVELLWTWHWVGVASAVSVSKTLASFQGYPMPILSGPVYLPRIYLCVYM